MVVKDRPSTGAQPACYRGVMQPRMSMGILRRFWRLGLAIHGH